MFPTDSKFESIMPRHNDGRHGVGHFGNATRRGVLKLSSSISTDVWTPVPVAPLSALNTSVELKEAKNTVS